MNETFQKYATPLITWLFVISLVSGLALFFHVGAQYFRGMHEWLSLVVLIPFVLHLWKNWRSFVSYFKRWPMRLTLAGSLVAAFAFAAPAALGTGAGGRGNPIMGLENAVEGSTVAVAAPLFNLTSEELTGAIIKAGYTVSSPGKSIREIAAESGKDGFDLIGVIVAARK
jgi:hypothetical protein